MRVNERAFRAQGGKRSHSMKSKGLSVRVANVVATADLGQRIDLRIVGEIEGGLYMLEKYPCAYLKRPPMHGRVTVFGSGKLISVGNKSVSAARRDLHEVARILEQECGLKKVKFKIRVQNIVAMLDLQQHLNLANLNIAIPDTTYMPEVFPALIWKPSDLPATLLVFGSGKIVAPVKRMTDVRQLGDFVKHRIGSKGSP